MSLPLLTACSRNRVVIASIVRLILLVAFYFKHSIDLTNNLLLPWFVTVAEIGVGIVGACLPCLMVSASLPPSLSPFVRGFGNFNPSLESLTRHAATEMLSSCWISIGAGLLLQARFERKIDQRIPPNPRFACW